MGVTAYLRGTTATPQIRTYSPHGNPVGTIQRTLLLLAFSTPCHYSVACAGNTSDSILENFVSDSRLRTAAVITVLLVLSSGANGAITTCFENMDSDPGWTSQGSGVNGNDFGYRPTSFAGGSAGEIGGHFTRSMFQRAYGDTDLGGELTLDNSLSASGKFGFTGASSPDFGTFLEVGYYRQVQSPSLMGINVGNGQGGPLRLFGLLQLLDGSYVTTSEVTPTAGIPLLWSTNWNPLGGIHNAGRYSVTIGGNTSFVDLTAAQRAVGASFDSFGLDGLNNFSSNNSNQSADFFVDDLSYNEIAPVPEPSSVVIWSFCVTGSAVVGYRRSKRAT